MALAFVVAAIARSGATDATLMLNYEQEFYKILAVSVVFITCMYYFDLYDSFTSNRRKSAYAHDPGARRRVHITRCSLLYLSPP